MLLDALVQASAQVAATRSRLAKRAVLAEVLGQAAPDEIGLVATYLSGSLRQRRTGVGWASLHTTPAPAEVATLEVADVDALFERMSIESGEGSAARRTAELATLFAAATTAEQQFLSALIFGELRQGASDSLVQDALAAVFQVPLAAVSRAAMLTGSTASAATLVATGVLMALHELLVRASARWSWLSLVTKGRSVRLVDDGAPIESAMRRAGIGERDLRLALRSAGHADLGDVQSVTLERNGDITVVGR